VRRVLRSVAAAVFAGVMVAGTATGAQAADPRYTLKEQVTFSADSPTARAGQFQQRGFACFFWVNSYTVRSLCNNGYPGVYEFAVRCSDGRIYGSETAPYGQPTQTLCPAGTLFVSYSFLAYG
jgi:hypothetical protein